MSKCWFKLTRILIALFSVLFVIFGSVFTGLVAYIQLTEQPFSKDIPNIAKYVCIALHVCLAISGILGICAAFWSKKWLFSILLPILIITYASHLALAASLLINSTLVKGRIGDVIDNWQGTYQYTGKNGPTQLMDIIHEKLHCCGSQSHKDYRSSTLDAPKIPWSCCNVQALGAAKCEPKDYSLPYELAYDRGCRSVATEFAWRAIRVVLFASVGLTGLELLTIVLSLSACCLCRSPDDRRRRRRYSALPLPDGFPPGGHETVL